jgi:hypothetical protein
MAPKRKSDALFEHAGDTVADAPEQERVDAKPTKQARVADAADAPSAASKKVKKGKAKETDDADKPKHWSEVKLEGEDEVSTTRSRTSTRQMRVRDV